LGRGGRGPDRPRPPDRTSSRPLPTYPGTAGRCPQARGIFSGGASVPSHGRATAVPVFRRRLTSLPVCPAVQHPPFPGQPRSGLIDGTVDRPACGSNRMTVPLASGHPTSFRLIRRLTPAWSVSRFGVPEGSGL